MNRLDTAAHWLYSARLIPGWLLNLICDRYDASIWRGFPDCTLSHVTYNATLGLFCGCGQPYANITTSAS